MRTCVGSGTECCRVASTARLWGRLSLRKISSAMARVLGAGMIRQMPSADTTSRLTPSEVLTQIDGPATTAAVERARAITDIVAGLTDDADILMGATLYPLLASGALTPE